MESKYFFTSSFRKYAELFAAGVSVKDNYCVVDYPIGESGGTNQALFGICDCKMPVLSMFVFAVQKQLAEESKIFFCVLSKMNISRSQTLVF